MVSYLSTITQCCDRLRRLSTHDLIETWAMCLDAAMTPAELADSIETQTRTVAELDERRYALWPRGRVTAWFTTAITVPDALEGYAIAGKTLRLALRWWAEDAQVFVNGVKVLAGDLYDCFGRVVLSTQATPGETIELAIRLVSPGHDLGALVTSVLQYESKYEAGCLDPAFVADELAVVVARLGVEAAKGVDGIASTNSVDAGDSVNSLDGANDVNGVNNTEIDDRLSQLITGLEPLLATLAAYDADSQNFSTTNFTTTIDQQLQQLHQDLARDFPRDALTINLLTHAHLDMAWLWPIAETYDAAQRTFESVLNLQTDYPDTIYTHSSPALYAWIEQHRPDLFTQIQAKVHGDRWDVAAGMWVEPELNIISGESITRQILYGQRYCEAKFGQISRVAWLPDSFGFCWQLPQFLTQGGIDYFVTQKLRWNDTTEFPYELFHWQAPDGTQIPAWMAPPIGQDITPVEMVRYATQWQTRTDRDTALWLPGAGDHGGGPTRDMLDRVQRWQTSPVFPVMQFQSSADFLDTVTRRPPSAQNSGYCGDVPKTSVRSNHLTSSDNLNHSTTVGNVSNLGKFSNPGRPDPSDAPDLPLWSSELYLELHRGCYTTYASQKRANRTSEILLYQAELYASIATLYTQADYPAADLEAAWKRVLLNQFHDILPGSAIHEVFIEADRDWAIAETAARSVRDAALQAIGAHVMLAESSLQSHPEPPLSSEADDPRAHGLAHRIDDGDDGVDRGVALLVFNPVLGQRSELMALNLADLADLGDSSNSTNLDKLDELDDLDNLADHRSKVQTSQSYTILDDRGTPINSQQNGNTLYFLAHLPSLGVQRYWLQPITASKITASAIAADHTADAANMLDTAPIDTSPERLHNPPINTPISTPIEPAWILENAYLRVEIHPQTGDILRCFDHLNQRELLAPTGGNRLEAYRDQGQYWDAWNIDPNYEKHPIAPPVLESIQWMERGLEAGLLRSRLRVIRRLNTSPFIQDYILDRDSPLLEIASVVDWRERHVVVKAAFDLAFSADRAVYETPCGAIERPIRPQTDADRAQWEVPMLQWCDLSQNLSQDLDQELGEIGDATYGVSLLNDCKYGGDATPDRLRLTLLRGSTWPDPQACLLYTSRRYALYAHAGTWQTAATVRRAIAFNQPPILTIPALISTPNPPQTPHPPSPHLPLGCDWLQLGSEQLVLMTVKRSEDDDRWLLRCYESAGETAPVKFSGALELRPIAALDLLERPHNTSLNRLEPWRIASFAIDSTTPTDSA